MRRFASSIIGHVGAWATTMGRISCHNSGWQEMAGGNVSVEPK